MRFSHWKFQTFKGIKVECWSLNVEKSYAPLGFERGQDKKVHNGFHVGSGNVKEVYTFIQFEFYTWNLIIKGNYSVFNMKF